MARNRRTRGESLKLGPALKAVVLCLALGGASLGYVWQHEQVFKLGQLVRQREQRLEWLQRQNKLASDNLAVLCSPPALMFRVRQLGLGLEPAQPTQIVRLPEPSVAGPLASRPASSAGSGAGSADRRVTASR